MTPDPALVAATTQHTPGNGLAMVAVLGILAALAYLTTDRTPSNRGDSDADR